MKQGSIPWAVANFKRDDMMFKHEIEMLINESNSIEGIHREATDAEIEEYEKFLALDKLRVSDMIIFVSVFEPTAMIRTRPGMNVFIGTHRPIYGGPRIYDKLHNLLQAINEGLYTPWEAHNHYEKLHPFSDGNGRSGRIIWTWQMNKSGLQMFKDIGFLHNFYYQTLSESRVR